MDWKKPIKDLTQGDIQVRRDFLIHSLQIQDISNKTYFWEMCMLWLKQSNKYYVLARAIESNIKHREDQEYYHILIRSLEDFTVESDRDKEIIEDVKKNCHVIDVYGLVLNNRNYDYDSIYKNDVEQEFYDKLNFVREMYMQECKENDRKVNEFFVVDSDYEEQEEDID